MLSSPVHPFENQNHICFLDNLRSSLLLTRYLKPSPSVLVIKFFAALLLLGGATDVVVATVSTYSQVKCVTLQGSQKQSSIPTSTKAATLYFPGLSTTTYTPRTTLAPVITTSTSTIYTTSTATVYAACSSNNIIRYVSGNDIYSIDPYYDYSKTSDADETSRCNSCQAAGSSCGGSFFLYGVCYFLTTSSDISICDPSRSIGSFGYDSAGSSNDNYAIVISNSGYGTYPFGGPN